MNKGVGEGGGGGGVCYLCHKTALGNFMWGRLPSSQDSDLGVCCLRHPFLH